MSSDLFYTKLSGRGLIHVEGADAETFLQNLITNNMETLEAGKILYACLLSPQGKFLFDFFVHRGDGFYLLDCEGGERAQDLFKRLSLYRLRADVQLSVEEDIPVYAVFGSAQYGIPDPRHTDLGYRSFEKPQGMEERPFAAWDARRIALSIPDGSRDLVVGTSTMDEAHMDQIGAISYTKGCYIGQELTARMHYRGLGKKHLQTVRLDAMPEKAELRSSCGDIGLALVRDHGDGAQ